MRQLRALARSIALTEALVLLLGLAVLTGTGWLDQVPARLTALALAVLWVFICLVTWLAARVATRPLAAALEAPAPEGADADASRANAAAIGLPALVSLALFLSGALGAGIGVVIVGSTRQRIPPDVALATFGIGVAVTLLGAMIGYALTARIVAELLGRLGSVDARRLGTMRSKILVLAIGLNVIGVLLLSSAGYVRFRESVVQDLVASVGSRADAAVLEKPGRPPGELAWAVQVATGCPSAVLSATGALLATAGEIPEVVEGPVSAVGAARKSGGWTVTRWMRPSGFVEVYVSEAQVRDRLRGFARSLLVVVLVIFSGTTALAWLAASAITLPLSTLGKAAERLAAGDFTAPPPTMSGDEVGGLAVQFRGMVKGLSGLVREVQAASESVSTGAREAGAIGDRVRRGALDQHAGVRAVHQAVAAMEGSMSLVSRGLVALSDYVSATTRAVSDMAEAFDGVQHKAADMEKAMEASIADVERLGAAGADAEGRLASLESLAARAGGTLADVKASVAGLEQAAGESEGTAAAVAELAEKAGTVMAETVLGIETLRHAVADAHQRIAVLGRRSDDIDQVVDFISEVAGRTNLLSLNASIIAAQAGEHGKSFAVVADQIRDLASQIARSTSSIGDIIRAVREDVEGTASLIERGDALASEGVQLARNSLEALAEIRSSTGRGRETAAGIRTAVQAHAAFSREVANVVEHVAEGSRAVAAAVQLVGRSVGGVHSVSRGVSGTADRVARTLEEQGGVSRRQLENLSQLEKMIQEITQAVEDHSAATQQVQIALEALTSTAGEHEQAVNGLSGVADQISHSARALAERVNRFRV